MEKNVDYSSNNFQKADWDKLKKTIFTLLNKVNALNVGTIKIKLLRINILRGRGIFCQYIMQAQLNSTTYTHVYATLVALINLKFPCIGELLLRRCIMTFKSAYHRNEKSKYMATGLFIVHLINQSVANRKLAVEILKLLLKQPSVVSIELALVMLDVCGKTICEVYNKEIDCVLEEIKNILSNKLIDQQVQQLLSIVFKFYESGFKLCKLDLVPNDGQWTHLLSLDDVVTVDNSLDNYQYDSDFETNETMYKLTVQELDSEDDENDLNISDTESRK